MKILHVIEDFSIHSGGLRTVVKELNKRLNENGFVSCIISSKAEKEDKIHLVKVKNGWLYSKDWEKKINQIKNQQGIDVIHIHGVWMYPNYKAAKLAVENKIPFVLTPHGMYEPWLWEKSKIKKHIYFNFLTKKIFKKAKTIHAITKDEKVNLSKIFKNNTLSEIPNLIDFNTQKSNANKHDKEKYILYVGRLDKKKGIEILLKSYSKLSEKTTKLKIAGPFNQYKSHLEQLVEDLGVKKNVEFLGLVKGEAKTKLYKNAFVFVAPSYSEVVGMVNLEAALHKTPVITTYQTGLRTGWNNNGGILINPNEKELFNALSKVLNWTINERNENGEKLYNFVKKEYSWQNKIEDWKRLYIETKKK